MSVSAPEPLVSQTFSMLEMVVRPAAAIEPVEPSTKLTLEATALRSACQWSVPPPPLTTTPPSAVLM